MFSSPCLKILNEKFHLIVYNNRNIIGYCFFLLLIYNFYCQFIELLNSLVFFGISSLTATFRFGAGLGYGNKVGFARRCINIIGSNKNRHWEEDEKSNEQRKMGKGKTSP